MKANEPPVFVELGPAGWHVFIGFVKQFNNLPAGGTGSITGTVRYNHFSRPPYLQGYFPGPPVGGAWVGLNDPFSKEGLYTAPCDPETGEFTINNVPEGTYELVTWDESLVSIFGFNQVTVPPGGGTVDLGNVLAFRWFGTFEGSVFYDTDQDGFPDDGEPGIWQQNINLRFRDGRIYQAQPTDVQGGYSLETVFPFFKWLIPEVDFARFRDTGLTAIVDAGGEIQAHDGWNMPSYGKLNPQPQAEVNPNTGNNLSRTFVSTTPGEALLQAMHLFLSQTNIIHWGKHVYDGIGSAFSFDNGGISGMVYYAITRAENDPRSAAAEEWEPGIPRVQINLYQDMDEDEEIDDFNGDGPTLADVDNYPFGWRDGTGPFQPGIDVDRNGNGTFEPGDAIQIVYTDSFDDNKPEGSIGPSVTIHGTTIPPGFDNFGTWNQVRPGVFDGGFAIASHFPGGIASGSAEVGGGLPSGVYIVEAATPPGYKILKEEDKNVDFGDDYVPSPQFLPPICVGDDHVVPQYLSFQTDEAGVPLPGIAPGDLIEAPFAGETRPLADRKQVGVTITKNAGVEFFCFTDVPKAARAVGFINNDFAAEFDPTSPIFGEKSAPSWLPISFQDWRGSEVARVYCDEFGAYNAMVPSNHTVNIPAPSGVAPQMLTFVINHPGPIPDPDNPGNMIIDPYFDADFSQSPFTFNFNSASTTYLDTPVVPVAAFVGYPNRKLDIEPPTLTPMIKSVEGSDGGPVVVTDAATVTITSVGLKDVPNPGYDPDTPGSPVLIQRNFGFGTDEGTVTVGGVALDPADVSWTDGTITATIAFASVSTGTVHVTRGDNGLSTELGVTLHVNPTGGVVHVEGGSFYPNTPIQDAIDGASPGDLIIIEPGTYWENPVVYKAVTLQGSGAESTVLNAMPVPSEKVTSWMAKVNQLNADGSIPTDAAIFDATQLPGILVYANPGALTAGSSATVDGLQITGASAGGGIQAAGNAHYLEIRNNKVKSNQGTNGGGITIGQEEAGLTTNQNVNIHHNHIVKNGGLTGGGVTIYDGSTNYQVVKNLIMGNFTGFCGAGVAHLGLSNGGLIAQNQIVFNEVFYGGERGGDGGGVYIASTFNPVAPPQLSTGAGSVTVNANLIQGNLAGSGFGAGICAKAVNGQDVADNPGDPDQWYSLNIFNNMIVNNVAANAAGGIFLYDAVNVRIIDNTIADNDSSATAANAFTAGDFSQSNPQPAGVVSALHSPILALYSGQEYSNPVLADDIIYGNRSFYWDASLNGFQGGLVANASDPVWDLAVLNPVSPTQVLNPDNCLLTSLTDSSGNDYNDGTNIPGNPAFVNAYNNTLVAAAVLDEGGNFITIRFNEIDRGGDYHITSTSNAVGMGGGVYISAFPELHNDYDGENRLYVMPPDIGADQWTIISNTFDMGPDGFTYLDDTFRSTSEPDYARGNWSNGQEALVIRLGNVDNATVAGNGMSGGFRSTFSTRYATTVTLTLDYWFMQTGNYEPDEYSDVLVSIDGILIPGGGPDDSIYRITGDGNGGGNIVSGSQTFTYTTPVALPAGDHTITVGAYNNQKDRNNESTQLRIYAVKLTP